VLHHLEVEQSLRRIRALLPSGGAMAFAEPNMLNPQIAIQKNIPAIKKRLGDSPDETAFIRWPLQRWLQQAGFQEVRITPFDFLHPRLPAALIARVEALGAILEKTPIICEIAGSLFIRALK
jgi:hypothetical protein